MARATMKEVLDELKKLREEVRRLREERQPQYVPMPYPVYPVQPSLPPIDPFNPWVPPTTYGGYERVRITCADGVKTGTIHLKTSIQ